MLRKKYMVQKSFRIDRDLEKDLSILAELTNRSQNDLVNLSIEEFLISNKEWFIENSIVEHFQEILDFELDFESDIIPEPFIWGNLTVELYLDNLHTVKCIHKVKEDMEDIENCEYEYAYSTEGMSELKNHLRLLAQFINSNSEEAKKYLDERLDYNDFVSIKK